MYAGNVVGNIELVLLALLYTVESTLGSVEVIVVIVDNCKMEYGIVGVLLALEHYLSKHIYCIILFSTLFQREGIIKFCSLLLFAGKTFAVALFVPFAREFVIVAVVVRLGDVAIQ